MEYLKGEGFLRFLKKKQRELTEGARALIENCIEFLEGEGADKADHAQIRAHALAEAKSLAECMFRIICRPFHSKQFQQDNLFQFGAKTWGKDGVGAGRYSAVEDYSGEGAISVWLTLPSVEALICMLIELHGKDTNMRKREKDMNTKKQEKDMRENREYVEKLQELFGEDFSLDGLEENCIDFIEFQNMKENVA